MQNFEHIWSSSASSSVADTYSALFHNQLKQEIICQIVSLFVNLFKQIC